MNAQIGQVLATYWRRAVSERYFMWPAAALALGIVAIAIVAVGKLADPADEGGGCNACGDDKYSSRWSTCAAMVGPFLIAMQSETADYSDSRAADFPMRWRRM